jgi:hypothetical protein
MTPLNRRTLLLSSASLGLIAALPLQAETLPPIHVVKGTGCECCAAWVGHLRAEGFLVTEEELYGMLLTTNSITAFLKARSPATPARLTAI